MAGNSYRQAQGRNRAHDSTAPYRRELGAFGAGMAAPRMGGAVRRWGGIFVGFGVRTLLAPGHHLTIRCLSRVGPK